MTTNYANLICGEWIGVSDTAIEDRNPAKPDDIIGYFPNATRTDVRRAIEGARAALPDWAATPPPARGAILYKAAQIVEARVDELAALLTREEGKTLGEARGEVLRCRDLLRFFAGEGSRYIGQVLPPSMPGELLYTQREPLGVVALITPWNFPIAIPTWKLAPALIFGNTVILKPASYTPLIALRLVEILLEAGLPRGVLSFVTGPGREVGDELASNPGVNGISFTGSYAVGTGIYAKAIPNLTRVQLEMGGKNPLVVLDDASIPQAVKIAVSGGYGLTGQACTATSRVIVEQGIAGEFAEALAEAARGLVVGDGATAGTQMGPAVSQDQFDTDLRYMQIARDEGAKLLAGGGQARDGGYYVQPTVFDGVEPQMRIAQEEVFGPVIGIMRAADLDDTIAKANGIAYGLSTGVVTNDLRRAFVFANRAEAGVVKVNESTSGLLAYAPFGGFKHSSANTFKEQGAAAVEFYTRLKTVYVAHG